MAFDTTLQDPAVLAKFAQLRDDQARRIAEWARPTGVCLSGFAPVERPVERSTAELMAAAELEVAQHRAWRDSPEQVAERARVQAIRAREDDLDRAFWGAVVGQEEAV